LAHELGHALGVTLPRQGHTDIVGGLDITNVMTRGYDDTDPGGRRRLTVGQVFRMNSDSASWLSWATAGAGVLVREAAQPRLACQCGVADAAGRCPRVADDVARPSAAPDGTDPWDCFDLLKIKNAPAFEHPVAIMAGRSWRVPPAGCSAALPGWEANHWYGIFVGVGNVTRRGDCETSAVVFFRRHRPIFADLTQSYHSQTQVADQMVVYNLLTKPLEVRVRLYGPPLSALLFTDDVNYARTVFGPANRSGIALVFVNGGTTCPPGVPNLPDLVVCYAPWMPFEGTLDGQGRIRVGKSGVTTLAHLIGRALGLEPLAAATPGYPLNIMHSAPADRGRKLTLGQVYRINARLGVLSGCNPTPCPPQDMDVGP
ncbi:MAG TPA: hypothetical protein VFT84_11960, partial [Gemmatimonadales bacterium]|nr:hypothetical protein [Gemmatimonadales bacterium]